MNGSDLASLLANTPPTHLDIIRIAQQNTLPDGSLDLEALITRTPELQAAREQADRHAQAVQRLRSNISCYKNSHRY